MLCIPTKSVPACGMKVYVRHCSNSILTPVYLLCHFCDLNKHSYFIWKSLQLLCFVIYKGMSTFWLGVLCPCMSHRICTMLVCPEQWDKQEKKISDNLIFRAIFAKGIEWFQSYVSISESQQEKVCNTPKCLDIDYVKHLKTTTFKQLIRLTVYCIFKVSNLTAR